MGDLWTRRPQLVALLCRGRAITLLVMDDTSAGPASRPVTLAATCLVDARLFYIYTGGQPPNKCARSRRCP